MRCRPTLQDTTNPHGLRRDTQFKLSYPTSTGPGSGDVNWQREFNVYNASSKSWQDALSTQNTSQRPQHHKRVSSIIHRDAPQTPLIRNSRSTTDPKTQKCAADRHCKIQQIPMVYEGTPNASYLIQLPLDQDRRCQLAKRIQRT